MSDDEPVEEYHAAADVEKTAMSDLEASRDSLRTYVNRLLMTDFHMLHLTSANQEQIRPSIIKYTPVKCDNVDIGAVVAQLNGFVDTFRRWTETVRDRETALEKLPPEVRDQVLPKQDENAN